MVRMLLGGVAACCAVIFGLVGVGPAWGANIAAFSQTSQSNTVQASTNQGDSATLLQIADATLSIGQFVGNPVLPPAFFTLNASSIDAATTIGTAVLQHYAGGFCITSKPGCTGVDILSGDFSDAALGGLGGPGLVINTNNPPDALTLFSDIVPAGELAAPNSFGLTFTNLVPDLAILGTTIAPFAASFAGTVSASPASIPEPWSVGILGLGLAGLAVVRYRRG